MELEPGRAESTAFHLSVLGVVQHTQGIAHRANSMPCCPVGFAFRAVLELHRIAARLFGVS